MAPRRLSEDEKQALVVRYRGGEATAALAAAFGCSPNTVSRTVKSLLSEAEYTSLKLSRQKGVQGQASVEPSPVEPTPIASSPSVIEPDSEAQAQDALADQQVPVVTSQQSSNASEDEEQGSGILALDDADDFADDSEEESDDEDVATPEMGAFQELVPLMDVGDLTDRREIQAQPLRSGILPSSVYMLVDKVVELDPKPLRDFPELGPLDATELERTGLCLFSSPRTAKRQCGRSQRVIKVPDTGVFERTSSYLLARGITRLVIEGTLIAIDRD